MGNTCALECPGYLGVSRIGRCRLEAEESFLSEKKRGEELKHEQGAVLILLAGQKRFDINSKFPAEHEAVAF